MLDEGRRWDTSPNHGRFDSKEPVMEPANQGSPNNDWIGNSNYNWYSPIPTGSGAGMPREDYTSAGPRGTRPYEPPAPPPGVDDGPAHRRRGGEPPPDAGEDDSVSVQDLYPEKPELSDFNTPTVGSPTGASVTLADKDVTKMNAYGADFDTEEYFKNAQENVLGQAGGGSQSRRSDNQLVDKDLARIMQQDSPLLSQARAEGMRLASRRGLQNSSMAAGQAYGQMVKAALPMAQQNAAQEYQRSVENARLAQEHAQFRSEQAARLAALEAELGVEMSIFNAEQLNQAERLTTELRTALEQGDQEAANAAQRQLAELERDAQAQQAEIDYAGEERQFLENQAYNEQIIEAETQLNERYMIGEQNMDLAKLNQTYQQLIAMNSTAGGIYEQTLAGISNILSNPELSTAQAAEAVRALVDTLAGSLRMISEMNDMEFDVDVGLPPGGSGGTGGGGGSGGGGGGRNGGRRRYPDIM